MRANRDFLRKKADQAHFYVFCSFQTPVREKEQPDRRIYFAARVGEKKPQGFVSLLVDSVAGPQLKNPCNCLPKTQVCANTKVDVYGLTPARCRKVKGMALRSELKPR